MKSKNAEKNMSPKKSTDKNLHYGEGDDASPKNLKTGNPSYSEEVKTENIEKGFQSLQDLDDEADWNMQSGGSRNLSTRGQNEAYDYDEDDQEDENLFIAKGLEAAERDRDYDQEAESSKKTRRTNLEQDDATLNFDPQSPRSEQRYADPKANTPPTKSR